MTQHEAVARVRLWLLRAYITDLEAFRDGDSNRFGRMVGGRGESLGSAEKWTAFIITLLQDTGIKELCSSEWQRCRERATLLNIGGAA